MTTDDPEKAFTALAGSLRELDVEELREIGLLAETIIITRAKRGLNVDGKLFKRYSPAYAKVRAKLNLATARVDLTRANHMFEAMTVEVPSHEEVLVTFASDLEAKIAASHNDGVEKTVPVRKHARGAYFDTSRSGARVSRKDWKKDQRRKNKRVVARTEKVRAHERDMNLPQREFLDIRQRKELRAIEERVSEMLAQRAEDALK